ncbi:multiple sugar transport system substrate-binding protein [Abditibacterium utsteinense]|uniref:Multiple sugar transport system substrate-binding protein n=1 Tax=Abditibacterium utsteinense TaxID=1960156 RepID=A0A2S8SQK2_9BACT|nr:extracellular solute-binding protein [Abditibacterium utsteinense]PQV63070.1 multiple sugar transport system substrate-binding protein [Abditibacterium utsteinense]
MAKPDNSLPVANDARNSPPDLTRDDGAQLWTFSRRGFLQVAGVSMAALLAGCARSNVTGARVTLTQWYHQYGEEGTQSAVRRYAAQYVKANPDVAINVVWVPGNYLTKLNTALLVAGGPDIFESDHLSVPMVTARQVAPLDDLFPPAVRRDFLPADLKVNSVNGHIYGVKMVSDTGLLYFRPSLLQKAGIKAPQSADELLEAAKNLTTSRRKGLFLGNDGGIGPLGQIMVWSAGEHILADNKVAFETPRVAQAYEKLRDFNQSDALLIGAKSDWWDPSAFNDGLCAMAWGGLWAYPAIKKALGDDVGGLAWPPLDAQGKPATFSGGWSQFVNSRSPNIEESKKYLRWLCIENPEIQQDWNLNYGFHVPPRQSVARAAKALDAPVAARAAQNLAKYGHLTPPAWSNSMGSALSDAVTNIVKLNRPAPTELEIAARKVERELERLLR